MTTPKISMIMPVYNAEAVLEETVSAIRDQIFQDFEVICVDNGSTDSSGEILKKTAQADSRFRVFTQEHAGAGAARNYGLSCAEGEYVIFLNSDDLFCPELLETLCKTADASHADITACNFSRFGSSGKDTKQTGVYTNWLPAGTTVFNYQTCPDYILRIAGPMVWNKLYRREFLIQNALQFDELSTCNDLAFTAVSLACAERITYTTEALVRCRISATDKPNSLKDVQHAVESAVAQLRRLPHGALLKNAVSRFVVENYITALKKQVTDFSAPDAESFYRMVHETFNNGEFQALEPQSLHNNDLYREFCTVQKHGYAVMKQLSAKRLIVSLTSYPRRIHAVVPVLETIYAQTKKADEIILWLAQEQFPEKEKALPEDLLRLVREKRLTLRWCEDLKPHKKYFYAFREYPNDLVVTIDDDLRYPSHTLASLYASYLLYPQAVSALRAHLMVLSEDGRVIPYGRWIHETDMCLHKPSMQLMATGVGGILYPPHLFRKEFLDEQAIRETCLWADDLWLKAMELISDVPVVLARAYEPLHFLPDTQEDSLFVVNSHQGQNDIQLQNILQWTDKTFGAGTLIRKLTQGTDFLDIEAVTWKVELERRSFRNRLTPLRNELEDAKIRAKQAEAQQKLLDIRLENTENRLQQTREKLAQTEKNLVHTQSVLKQTEDKLTRTQIRLKETIDSKPIARQLQALGQPLHQQRAKGLSPMLLFKLLIYYLAWIPETLLAVMMYYLQNGMKLTLKHFCNKLLRRK